MTVNRSESLALLRTWANRHRPGGRPLTAMERGAALKHGLAAVRAIQNAANNRVVARMPRVYPAILVTYAAEQARLAFRSALNAVGLKTL